MWTQIICAWVFFEALTVIMGIYAYKSGYLLKRQKRIVTNGHPVAVLIQHTGIWGDVVAISPTCAFMFAVIHNSLLDNRPATFACISASVVLSAKMMQKWASDSKSLNESLAINGETTVAGYIHVLYMILTLSEIFLYYFVIDAKLARPSVTTVSSILAVHIAQGTILPDLIGRSRLQKASIPVVLIAWALIGIGWLQVVLRAKYHH